MFKITNGNEFNFVGRFDGKDYLFPKGESVACDDEAAKHIFGIGDDDKTPYLVRHGWLQPTSGIESGLSVLNKFKFEFVMPKNEVRSALIEHGQAPVPQEAPDDENGTDGLNSESGAIQSAPRRGRPPLDRLHRAVA